MHKKNGVHEIYICAWNTSENAGNLPVLTDSRVDPDNSTARERSLLFLSWGSVVLVLKVLVVWKGSDITEEIPLSHMEGVGQWQTHAFLWWFETCSLYAIWWWFSMPFSWTLPQCVSADKHDCCCRDLQRSKFTESHSNIGVHTRTLSLAYTFSFKRSNRLFFWHFL